MRFLIDFLPIVLFVGAYKLYDIYVATGVLMAATIAQMALMDVVVPTNWAPTMNWLGWNSSLDRYAWSAGSNRVELREFPSERVLASFSGPSKATVDQAVLSSDNQFLAVRFSNADGKVMVWKLDDQKLILQTTCEGFNAAERRIYFSPDSRTLALLTPQGVAVQAIAAVSARRLLQKGRLATRIVFSPDSKHIAVLPAHSPNAVEIWDVASGETRGSFQVDFPPWCLAWHPDGTRLALGGERGRLELRTLVMEDAGRFRASGPVPLQGHLGAIPRVGFAPDGSTLLTSAWDASSIVWDLISGRPLLREQRLWFTGIGSTGGRVSAERDGKRTVSALIDRKIGRAHV